MKKTLIPIKFIILTAGILMMTGCVRQTDTPIVSETPQSPPKNFTQAADDFTPEEENGGGTIWEQTQPPEVYTADIRSETTTLTANAKVEVSKNAPVTCMEAEYFPYTVEELENLKEVLKKETGVDEWVKNQSRSPETYASSDQAYHLALSAGGVQEIPMEIPMIWLTHTGLSDGSSKTNDADDLSGFLADNDKRKELENTLQEKSEQLLKKMDLKDFYLEDTRWRQLSTPEGGGWTLSGEYGLRLYYRRRINGLPLVNNERHYASTGLLAPAQYIEFLYKEDGTLLIVKNIGREKIVETKKSGNFLLPFSAISQVFEQYMKTLNTDSLTDRFPPHTYAAVTEVKLAYRLDYDAWDPTKFQIPSTHGKIVPVWAFYGSLERGYENQSGQEAEVLRTPLTATSNSLLLSINAEDGTIFGGQN